jgi:chloride channel protein, CIC family
MSWTRTEPNAKRRREVRDTGNGPMTCFRSSRACRRCGREKPKNDLSRYSPTLFAKTASDAMNGQSRLKHRVLMKHNLKRYVRWLRLLWFPRWRRRGFFVLGGLTVGALAVAIAFLADEAQAIFRSMRAAYRWSPLLVTPIGLAAAAWFTKRFAPNAAGSGIPQVIAARQLTDVGAREALVSIRGAALKMLLLLFGLLCGASAGREGPTVQVGAATMFALGRLEPHRQAGLLLAGSAAGVAAAFNAPLAGIVFGIEEMSRSFEQRSSGLIIGAVIAAGLTSLALVGDYTYFGTTPATLPIGREWIAVPIVGVLCGLAGGLFSRILIEVANGLPGRFGGMVRAWPVAFAFACGVAIVLCATIGDVDIYGTGYEQAQAILRGEPLSYAFAPLKLIATALSSISGIPGGLFSPSLAVGAGIGRNLTVVLPSVPIGVLAVLCMAAYLAGVVQAPITSFVIVSEMTENHALVIPIMLAALIATATSKTVCPEGVYHALSKRFLCQNETADCAARRSA